MSNRIRVIATCSSNFGREGTIVDEKCLTFGNVKVIFDDAPSVIEEISSNYIETIPETVELDSETIKLNSELSRRHYVSRDLPDDTTSDVVNSPKHYTTGKIECIDYIIDKKLGYCLGNAVKYITRCEHKGKKIEDLEKAIWYINEEIRITRENS